MKTSVTRAVTAGVWAISIAIAQQGIAAEHVAGMKQILVPSEERGTDLQVTIWITVTITVTVHRIDALRLFP
jgi:hypothetical protein